MDNVFEVVVIGAGPGGYVSAIRASQLGLKTACVDNFINSNGKYSLGGTCLNVGCIPSKALLESSENYERVTHKFSDHGIKVKEVTLDIQAMLKRKDKIVTDFTGGIRALFKKNKVSQFDGTAQILNRENGYYKIEIKNKDKTTLKITAKNIIIATGSNSRKIDGIEIDNKLICDNEGALSFKSVPKKLGIIGAGVIGLEMGSVWKRLGSQVKVLEALPEFLSLVDHSISKEAFKIFTKNLGLEISLNCQNIKIVTKGKKVQVTYNIEGKEHSELFDKLVISIGRVPNSNNITSKNLKLEIDSRNFIKVNDRNLTNLDNVYAIGDVVRGPMLAHKASEEGVAVAEIIAGQSPHINFDYVPWVIYTSPEIAWVGKNEKQLKDEGINYSVGQFPFIVSGRARALGETSGFVKILADKNTDLILGIHIIGPFASELIAEAVLALEFKASSEDIARIIHAHPSLSEALHEAALGVEKRSLHI